MTSVTERRLRLVYDLLDCGNNKKALQEADRLLKKQPNFICAKALRALALLRLDRQDECRSIVQAVEAELPTDENSLQVLTICYKELHEPQKICDLYEAVVKKEPNNEEFLSHLFMAYVRVFNYKKQQQTAMALYKAWPKNPYYFWAIMSVLMQASDGEANPAMPNKLSLQLAERLLQKIVRQNKVEAEAEVQLYLMVLERQENYEAALEVLNGRLANFLRAPNLIKTKRALYLEKMGRWRELALFTQELIRQDPSQWSYYQTHLRAVFTIHDQPSSEPTNNDVTSVNDVTPKNDVTSENDVTPKNDVTSENDVTPKNDVASVNDIAPKNDVTSENDVASVNDVTPENDATPKNDVTPENVTSPECDRLEEKVIGNHVENHVNDHMGDLERNHIGNHTENHAGSPSEEQQNQSSEAERARSRRAAAPAGDADGMAVSAADTARFLARLRATVDSRERAPMLAQLKLALELQRRQLPHPLPFDPVEAVAEFVSSYGDRPCCFSDLEPALQLVSSAHAQTLLDRCRGLVELEESGVPATMAQLQRHLTWLQLCQHYSATVRLAQERPARAAELCRHHQGTVRLSRGLLDTELRPNDQYLTLAVYCLYDEWTATDRPDHLLHALTLLEHGITLSPSNFYFKLAAIHIYNLLGAAGAAYTVYNTLDLKSIQLDTLGYVCSRHIAAQGHLAAAPLVFNTVLRFFSSARDTSECLIAAYKVGSFQQIPEFTQLKERLAHSTNYLLTLTDCVLLDLTAVASQHAQTLELLKYTSLGPAVLGPVAWEKQRDNRDVTALPAFSDAERRRRESARELSWRQDLRLLRLRQLTLRALVTALRLPADGQALTQLAQQLQEEVYRPEQLQQPARPQLSGPLPSRLPRMLAGRYLQLLSQLLTAAAAMAAGEKPTQQAAEVEALCASLAAARPAPVASEPAAALERAALLAETVSVAAAVCGAVHAWSAPARPAGKKGRKKKHADEKTGDADHPHNRIVSALLTLTRAACHLVAEAGTELSQISAASRLEQLQLSDTDGAVDGRSPLREAAARVSRNLDQSHRASVSELEKVLQLKVEYLTACLL